MSAELVDPFATHEPTPARASDDGQPSRPEQTTSSRVGVAKLTPDEWLAIRDEIHDSPWDDPTRLQDCLTEALKALGEIGTGNSTDPARDATQAMRRMCYRATSGIPFGEPQEPSWSLDSDRSFQ